MHTIGELGDKSAVAQLGREGILGLWRRVLVPRRSRVVLAPSITFQKKKKKKKLLGFLFLHDRVVFGRDAVVLERHRDSVVGREIQRVLRNQQAVEVELEVIIT